eukprot:TRINITY_DN28723_c0_g2_i2.p1 TRINITY_DN28723_c0_g2~~TRINITY_DN28723_c0_g2_i2.p1  ORF type:complete len:287 (-),score=66.33 TRINITY_DN28723_c0_g2_i2:335-1195(-)
MTRTIVAAIETGGFDYVNLHYHFIGSYTASSPHGGNLAAVRAAVGRDMGVFIISVNDKAGKLYKPSCRITELCRGPEGLEDPTSLEPIEFNTIWLWSQPGVHTVSVGAARPSDMDQPLAAAQKLLTPHGPLAMAAAEARLRSAYLQEVGDEDWQQNLPDCFETRTGVGVCYIVWLHGLVKAWGLLEYAKDRYKMLVSNLEEWDERQSWEVNQAAWSWAPGNAYRPDCVWRIREELAGRPVQDVNRVVRCLKEAHAWLTASLPEHMVAGCQPAYDLQRGKVPFPDRK